MGQGSDICKDALREAGNVIAMERPAGNRRFCNAQGSKVGSKDCGPIPQVQVWVAELDPTTLSLLQIHLAVLLLQLRPSPPACTQLQVGTGDTGTRSAAEKGPSRAVSRALGRYLQQPQGAEALKGQRRDALQGVIAEDPAEGKQATQLCVLQETHPGLHTAPSQTTASPGTGWRPCYPPAPPTLQGPPEQLSWVAAQRGTVGTSLTGW